MQAYPKGVWFLFFKGRLEFMKGNLDEALVWYKKSWKSQDMWPQFHHLCFWEILWVNWYVKFISRSFQFGVAKVFSIHCYFWIGFSAKLDWKEAEIFAAYLCEQSKWSRTIYTYQRAVVMLMRDKTDLTPAERQTIENLMRWVHWHLKYISMSPTLAERSFSPSFFFSWMEQWGASIQATHCRKIIADGKVYDKKGGTLFCWKEESCVAGHWTNVPVECI